jgi:hypothetical protein
MAAATHETKDAILFSYRIASGDMKYIETNERVVHYRSDSETGGVLWGEIPGCGESCNADLGQMILEYILACEGCDDATMSASLIDIFGKRLGTTLAAKIKQGTPDQTTMEWAKHAVECIHHSLNVPFAVRQVNDGMHFKLDHSPLRDVAARSGIRGRLELAYQVLYALYNHAVQALDPNLSIALPAIPQLVDAPLELALSPGTR